MKDLLLKYIEKFTHLRVDRSKGQPAPHKPLLLLSIIQEIEVGCIRENRIYITAELVARFKDNFFHIIKVENFTTNFSLPFYHLKSEGFWHFNYQNGKQLQLPPWFVSSRTTLRINVHCDYIIIPANTRNEAEIYEFLIDLRGSVLNIGEWFVRTRTTAGGCFERT